MIYVDSSVVLAQAFAERVAPPPSFWLRPLVSGRLLEYEVVNRVHARNSAANVVADARMIIDRMFLLDLEPHILIRALNPFPVSIRTLDGLHLATMAFLSSQGESVELASYDQRLLTAATAMGFSRAAI